MAIYEEINKVKKGKFEMKFFFDRQPVQSLDEAVGLYREEEFESPTRSTVPLLSSLKHAECVWKKILKEVGLHSCAIDAHLEFRVSPAQGSGKPSHTDLMLILEDRAVAIETKWTEPRYDDVGRWVMKGDNCQNRLEVMRGWLSLLQNHISKKLKLEDFSSAVYQMVHRAASACAGGQIPTLMYLQFCPLPNGNSVKSSLMDDLCHFHSLLGSPANFPFWLAKVTAIPNPAFENIKNLPKGLVQTAEAVRAALRGDPLFTFTDISFLSVKGADCK